MELEDCAGFDDSDVYPEGGLGIIGPVNSLMPRFDQEETSPEKVRTAKREETSSKKTHQRQLSARRGSGRLMSPSHVPALAPSTMLKVPASVI